MRFQELIKHKLVDNSIVDSWENLSNTNTELVGKINTLSNGGFYIYFKKDGINYVYLVVDDKDKENTIGYIILQPRTGTNYTNVRNMMVLSNYKNK